MSDLNVQKAFDRLEDRDENWALKLMDECELEMQSTHVDNQEIHVEISEKNTFSSNTSQAEQVSSPANENSIENSTYTTAIERQIRLKAEQTKSEPSNADKAAQGFWSLFRRGKAVN